MSDGKETADYLRGFARRHADVYRATVKQRLPNNVLLVERIDSKAQRYAKANAQDFHRINSWVDVQSADGSGNIVGGMDTVVSRAPERGLSETTPSTRTVNRPVAMVINVEPEPLEIERGGPSKEQIIFGVNLSEPGTYSASDADGDDPVIVSVSNTITGAKVTKVIRADAASPLGEFDMTINGVKRRKALRVVAARSSVLYVLGYSGTLFALDSLTLEVLKEFETGEWGGGAIGRMRANVAVATLDGLAVCNPVTGAVAVVPVTWPASWGPPYFFASYALECFFRSRESGDTYVDSIIADGSLTHTLVSGTDPVADTQLVANGSTIWSGDVNNRILKFDAETLASSFVAMPRPTSSVAVHAGSLYVASRDDSRTIYRRDLTTGAAISDIALPIAGTGNFAQLASAGGKLFACAANAAFTETHVFVLTDTLSSATDIATINGSAGQLVGDGSAAFVPDVSAGRVWRVAASNYAVTSSSVLDSEGVDTAFVYVP